MASIVAIGGIEAVLRAAPHLVLIFISGYLRAVLNCARLAQLFSLGKLRGALRIHWALGKRLLAGT